MKSTRVSTCFKTLGVFKEVGKPLELKCSLAAVHFETALVADCYLEGFLEGNSASFRAPMADLRYLRHDSFGFLKGCVMLCLCTVLLLSIGSK